MKEKIQFEEIVILRDALSYMIEYGFGYDENGNEIEGYCSISGEVVFKTEKEAMINLLKTDSLFQFVKDCNLNDKVIERYVGEIEEDSELTTYLLYEKTI